MLPNGNIYAPVSVQLEDPEHGTLYLDGMRELEPSTPEFEAEVPHVINPDALPEEYRELYWSHPRNRGCT